MHIPDNIISIHKRYLLVPIGMNYSKKINYDNIQKNYAQLNAFWAVKQIYRLWKLYNQCCIQNFWRFQYKERQLRAMNKYILFKESKTYKELHPTSERDKYMACIEKGDPEKREDKMSSKEYDKNRTTLYGHYKNYIGAEPKEFIQFNKQITAKGKINKGERNSTKTKQI